jgi:hypothetical protein
MAQAQAPAQLPAEGRPVPPRRRLGTPRDLVVSMVILIGLVLVLVSVLPRHHRDPVQQVDYRGRLAILATAVPFGLLGPAGLAPEWKATSVRSDLADAGQAEVHVGFVVDRGPRTYAALEQGNAAAPDFLKRTVPGLTDRGSVRAGGTAWRVYGDGAGHVALVRTAGSATAVVSDGGGSGGAGEADLLVLAGSLAPLSR